MLIALCLAGLLLLAALYAIASDRTNRQIAEMESQLTGLAVTLAETRADVGEERRRQVIANLNRRTKPKPGLLYLARISGDGNPEPME